ncbi:hypothetical protein ACTFIR_005715 [Dictyostelium discoideum]
MSLQEAQSSRHQYSSLKPSESPGQLIAYEIIHVPSSQESLWNVRYYPHRTLCTKSDIHEGENRFIHLSDIIENTKRLEEMFDMDFELASQQEERETEAASIDQILKPNQCVNVQVVKEAIGTKGARESSAPLKFLKRWALSTEQQAKTPLKRLDDYQIYQQCRRLYAPYATEHSSKIELYRDKFPMFDRFGVEREIEKSLKRKLWLNSGGYLFFDQTEAMHTIDVNSGRNTNIESGDVEKTLVRINLETAEEISKTVKNSKYWRFNHFRFY